MWADERIMFGTELAGRRTACTLTAEQTAEKAREKNRNQNLSYSVLSEYVILTKNIQENTSIT